MLEFRLDEYNLSILSLSNGAAVCGILRQAQNAGQYSQIVNSYRDFGKQFHYCLKITGQRADNVVMAGWSTSLPACESAKNFRC